MADLSKKLDPKQRYNAGSKKQDKSREEAKEAKTENVPWITDEMQFFFPKEPESHSYRALLFQQNEVTFTQHIIKENRKKFKEEFKDKNPNKSIEELNKGLINFNKLQAKEIKEKLRKENKYDDEFKKFQKNELKSELENISNFPGFNDVLNGKENVFFPINIHERNSRNEGIHHFTYSMSRDEIDGTYSLTEMNTLRGKSVDKSQQQKLFEQNLTDALSVVIKDKTDSKEHPDINIKDRDYFERSSGYSCGYATSMMTFIDNAEYTKDQRTTVLEKLNEDFIGEKKDQKDNPFFKVWQRITASLRSILESGEPEKRTALTEELHEFCAGNIPEEKFLLPKDHPTRALNFFINDTESQSNSTAILNEATTEKTDSFLHPAPYCSEYMKGNNKTLEEPLDQKKKQNSVISKNESIKNISDINSSSLSSNKESDLSGNGNNLKSFNTQLNYLKKHFSNKEISDEKKSVNAIVFFKEKKDEIEKIIDPKEKNAKLQNLSYKLYEYNIDNFSDTVKDKNIQVKHEEKITTVADIALAKIETTPPNLHIDEQNNIRYSQDNILKNYVAMCNAVATSCEKKNDFLELKNSCATAAKKATSLIKPKQQRDVTFKTSPQEADPSLEQVQALPKKNEPPAAFTFTAKEKQRHSDNARNPNSRSV